MPKGFYKGLLVAAVATITAIASLFAGGGARSDSHEKFSVADSTLTIRKTFKTSEGMSKARMFVHADVESGVIRWTLTDPLARVVLRGEDEGGRVSTDTGKMRPHPGIWVLTIKFDDATGRYGYDWTAR